MLQALELKELLKYLSKEGRKMTILDSTKSDALRCEYINKFVNTSSPYYKKYIEQKTLFSDGLCYTGYLWDCLLKPTVISEYDADQFLKGKRSLLIMWDIHSCERIFIPHYWKFPKTRILCTDDWTDSFKHNLPEDVYVFDSTISWSVIFTHETDEKEERYCLFVDKGFGNIPGKSKFG